MNSVERALFQNTILSKNMARVTVTVYKSSDGTFWCHTEQDVYGSGLTAVGTTVAEAKADLMSCFDDAKADYESKGYTAYPVEFGYKYDLQSFFEYFSFLNVTEIAKRAGINPSLMRQYVSGIKNAGEKTYERLSTCMTQISSELQVASF